MRDEWIEKYRDSGRMLEGSRDVLVAFNANIDRVLRLEETGIELENVEPESIESVEGLRQLKSSLKHSLEKSENREYELKSLDHRFETGKKQLGGQAGIMTNFLSNIGETVIFYTPLLSEKLAELVNDNVLFPVTEPDFALKNVRDAANTDQTKENLIFEYESEGTGRVIFSDSLKGFGPYFRKGIENNFPELEENIDRAILSGFHDVEGNREAKLEKAGNQLEKLDIPVHVEYVHRTSKVAELTLEHVIPEAESLGVDENELVKLCGLLDIDIEQDFSLGEAFNACKQIIEEKELERIHLHTYRFHLTVTRSSYEVKKKKILDAMLFGERAALKTAEKGELPVKEDLEDFSMEKMHLDGFKELNDFQDFFELENFASEGFTEIDGFKVVAIPTLIHEDPGRLVGLGDIISAGAFTAEIS